MSSGKSTVGLYQLRAAFKDPVHGLIPVNRLEYTIIQHPIFLRLHGIKQLGFTHLVYPQARHTRFEHSLGSMHIAHTMALAFLENSRDVVRGLVRGDLEERYPAFVQLVRLQALLHDLGHLPYSHATERILEKLHARGLIGGEAASELERARERGFKYHEYLSCRLIDRLSRDIGLREYPLAPQVFSGVRESLCRESDGRWRRVFTEMAISVARAMMSGKITDVDRMDYLLRDAYNTGATYGHYDVTRLATGLSLKLHEGRLRLAAPVKLLSNIEELYYSRYMMYKWVYLHHKVGALELTYEEVLRHMAEEWVRLRRLASRLLPRAPSSLWDLFTSDYLWKYATQYSQRVDDTLMETLIRLSVQAGGGELRRWAQGLVERRPPLVTLFKRQESLLLRLSGGGGGDASIEEGLGLLRRLASGDTGASADLDEVGERLEKFINSKLDRRGRVRVFINPPISTGGAVEPLIDVDGVLHPVGRVSVFINSIQRMGEVPIIYVYYIGDSGKDTGQLAASVAGIIREFLEKATGGDESGGKGLH